jgi:hypothetical protein
MYGLVSLSVLFAQRFWPGIADGSITVTFRRWKRARARVGAGHRTPVGLLRIDEVGVMETSQIDDADARRAGYPGKAALLEELGSGEVYRVEFHLEGPDPRIALRNETGLSAEDWEWLERRLARLDAASQDGPWTMSVLRVIAEQPATRAADLAAQFGREKAPFKRDVRKLKELGLTESLEVGYRLSPRGRALLARSVDELGLKLDRADPS